MALKLATSLDGRIADRFGRSRWISGEAARDYVHWLRAGMDAIGVGGATARVDDPSLTVRGAVEPRVIPLRVIFDQTGNLPTTLEVLRTAASSRPGSWRGRCCRVSGRTRSKPPAPGCSAPTGCRTRWRNSGRPGSPRSWSRVVVSWPGRCCGGGLVDRYYWIQSPVWLGEGGVPAVAGLPGVELATAGRWEVVERRVLGADTLLVVDRG